MPCRVEIFGRRLAGYLSRWLVVGFLSLVEGL